ncbi:MAG: orotidine-5'-phosphate decarboxylase [Zavarzinella sp.]
MSFGDRLAGAVLAKRTPLCVGLDPRWESLPVSFTKSLQEKNLAEISHRVSQFCKKVIDLVAPHVGVVKPQSAFFELLGPAGFAAQQQVIDYARAAGLIVILDAKRGDIASTATAYGEATFTGMMLEGNQLPVWQADALTVNPYLGEDAVEPFVSTAQAAGGGLFILVRTSNPGSHLFQSLIADGKPLYVHVAEAVARWNAPTVGARSLGSIGAVVGATHPTELAELRQLLPQVWFLVPGYGAQGGKSEDLMSAFRSDHLGAIINSSRGITFPYHPEDPQWEEKIVTATVKANAELRAAAGF